VIYTVPHFSPLVKITDGTCILLKHNRLIQQVKTSYPPISKVCLFVGLLFVLLCQVADAQVGWSDEPVFPMTPTIMSAGRWYITAGAKLRNLQSIRFNQVLTQDDWFYSSTGPWYQLQPTQGMPSVPFGPTTPGPFGTGTGRPGFLETLVPNWTYDNGSRRIQDELEYR